MAYVTYFAYGSNMLSARLIARCPSARALDNAKANAYKLSFCKKRRDGSAKATLRPTDQGEAYGVLFALDAADLEALDGFEGRGKGYDRDDAFPVIDLSSGEERRVITYLAQAGHIDDTLMPFDWYRALVLAGAWEHGLPGHYVAASIAAVPSLSSDRQGAQAREALQILEKAQFLHLLDL